MTKNVCYIDYDPAKTQLNPAFSTAIQPFIQEYRDGYIRVSDTAERVRLAADKHAQTGVKITAGAILSHNR